MHFPRGRGIYTGAAGSGMEIVRLQKPAKKDTQNRKRNTKGNKTDHQAIWKGREPKRRLGRVGDLARQERAGWTESEGEDGGKVTSRTVWCPSRALGKKKPYHPCPPTLQQPPRG